MKLLSKTSVALAIGALGLFGTAAAVQAGDSTTLHLEVSNEDTGDDGIKMTMPLDLIAAMAGSINTEESITSELFNEFESEGFDLRHFWTQVRDGNINDLFSMEVDDATIKAWRENGMFRMTIDAAEGGGSVAGRDRAQVEISIPESLMDLLVDQDGEVQPEDMVEHLRSMGPMTLVQVNTDKERVRIWLE